MTTESSDTKSKSEEKKGFTGDQIRELQTFE